VKENAHDRADIWGADAIQGIISRNAVWASDMLVAMVKSLMKDGRPIFTEKIPQQESLQKLLNAPPQFWEAIQSQDPEAAAALVAKLLDARMKGKIPEIGPRADEVVAEDGPAKVDTTTGTEAAKPIPRFTERVSDSSIG
jgi:hypothetical protein